jgi:hypothetical protein
MWFILAGMTVLALGIFIGYKAGTYFIKKENIILYKQVQLLHGFSQHWAHEATAKNELNKKVAEQQTQNTTTAIQTFIQLLNSFQQRQAENINQEEKEKLDRIINQVKNNFS